MKRAEPHGDLSRFAVHTVTTKPWPVETAIEKYARAGFGGITVWRDTLEGRDPEVVGQQIRDSGLSTVAMVRGGFFCYGNDGEREAALADNRQAIREAAATGAPMVVLVCGARPEQSLAVSREQIQEGIADLLPYAEEHGVVLAIEPLHPMYADTRSAVNDLATANRMAETLDSPWVGVAADVYHLWWDPNLMAEIRRCGKNGNLTAFHVCDWRVPTEDFLLDRGLMGEGCIDIPAIRAEVEASGFSGFNEVEIFSTRRWAQDQDVWLAEVAEACLRHV